MVWPFPERRECSRYERQLVFYLYGEASPAERHSLEAHLAECPRCETALADLRRILPLAVRRDEPPPGFWDAYTRELQAKIDAAEARPSLAERWRARLLPWPLPALATLLVIAIGVGLTLSGRERSTRATLDEEVLRDMPIAENLEFYRSLDLLDSLDLLEIQRSNPRNGQA
jgi:anti-sigma factor RsiW